MESLFLRSPKRAFNLAPYPIGAVIEQAAEHHSIPYGHLSILAHS